MDHVSPPNIFKIDIEVNDFMTPQGIYSIKIFVSLGAWISGQIMTPQPIYSIQIFVSLCQDFESIYSQFYLNFNQELGQK